MSEFVVCAACQKRGGQVWIEISSGEEVPFCLQCEPEGIIDRLETAGV